MKAKELYAKYKSGILSSDDQTSVQAVCDLIRDLSLEMKEIVSRRHIRHDSGAVAVILELNDKYNAICGLFEKEMGMSPIKRNGFLQYWERQIPALKERNDRKRGS